MLRACLQPHHLPHGTQAPPLLRRGRRRTHLLRVHHRTLRLSLPRRRKMVPEPPPPPPAHPRGDGPAPPRRLRPDPGGLLPSVPHQKEDRRAHLLLHRGRAGHQRRRRRAHDHRGPERRVNAPLRHHGVVRGPGPGELRRRRRPAAVGGERGEDPHGSHPARGRAPRTGLRDGRLRAGGRRGAAQHGERGGAAGDLPRGLLQQVLRGVRCGGGARGGRAAGAGARAPQPHAVDAGPVRGPDVFRGAAPFSVHEQGQHDVGRSGEGHRRLQRFRSARQFPSLRLGRVPVVEERVRLQTAELVKYDPRADVLVQISGVRTRYQPFLKGAPARWSQVSDVALLFYCGVVYCIAHIRSFLVYRDRFQQK
mmetsp:Transcript_44634/g.87512  ORF Transcript_44634/g.87512 Transcript_44634/m.87512 type:complete len:365 (-) Transcript_44634:157-1251(-)